MTIGRVLVTKQQPAEPNNFWCWLGSPPGAPPPNVEIGSLLVAEDEASQRSIIGMVDSLQHTSATLIRLLWERLWQSNYHTINTTRSHSACQAEGSLPPTTRG